MFSGVPADITQKSTDPLNFGKSVEFSQYNCVAFQAWWKDIDSKGIFQLQVSVKSDPAETDWVPKVGGEIETVGATGTDIKVVSNVGEKSIRIVWIPDTVTTGTISSELMAKDSSGPANFPPESPLNVTASFSGLRIAGRISEVELNDTTWTALPPTPLSKRNALSIQNTSGVNIKINYNNTEVGYFGVQIATGLERFYDLTDEIQIYAKAQAGTPRIIIEELS
jgi:hypothetical protein